MYTFGLVVRNKLFMTVGMLALAALSLAQAPTPPMERTVDERTGLPIVFVTEESMFPNSWIGGEIKAKAESLDTEQAGRAARLVKDAVLAYPKSVISNNLKRVYVMKQIEFYGLAYGGTNSLDRVYLTVRSANEGYTDSFIAGSFHHEFSSVLLRKYSSDFDEHGWLEANQPDFKYGNGGTAALRDGKASTMYDDVLAGKGLLTQYSTASIEEDFNMMAEGLFSGDKEYWRLVDKYPRAGRKMKIAVAFYSKLDPMFSEAFFRARRPVEG